MPELTDEDAIRMAVDYYEKHRGFRFEDAIKIVAILAKIDIAGLIRHTFNAGIRDAHAEQIGSMKR